MAGVSDWDIWYTKLAVVRHKHTHTATPCSLQTTYSLPLCMHIYVCAHYTLIHIRYIHSFTHALVSVCCASHFTFSRLHPQTHKCVHTNTYPLSLLQPSTYDHDPPLHVFTHTLLSHVFFFLLLLLYGGVPQYPTSLSHTPISFRLQYKPRSWRLARQTVNLYCEIYVAVPILHGFHRIAHALSHSYVQMHTTTLIYREALRASYSI